MTHHPTPPNHSADFMREVFERHNADREHADREKRIAEEMGAAALDAICAGACPETIREFGRRHRIPVFAEMTWNAGFLAGWRAYHQYALGRQERERDA